MDEEKKTTASDVLFGNVYQISEDMIQATYKLVEEISKFENVFHNMSKKLAVLNDNLSTHIVNKKWVKGTDKKRCQSKIDQAKALIEICGEYAKSCHDTAEDLIAITERFESNKKVRGIIKNLVDKIEGEAKKAKEEEDQDRAKEEDDCDDE
jgi:hypothetical protein